MSFLKKIHNLKIKILELFKSQSPSVIGIDLGTENTLICAKNKGILLNEPSIVAYINENGFNNDYLYGKKAKNLIGKTPMRIEVSKPLSDGVITNDEVCNNMIIHFIKTAIKQNTLFAPICIVGVPINATNVAKKIIQEVIEKCNVKEVYLAYESVLSAIGNNLPIDKPFGSMVIDIGGGTTEISVISLGGIIKSCGFNYGGRKMDEAIMEYIKQKYQLIIGINIAEEIKKKIGTLYLRNDDEIKTMQIQGRNLITRQPQEIVITQEDIVIALSEFSNLLIENVKEVLDKTPPELIKDIGRYGAIVCGGCANIQNIDFVLKQTANLTTKIQQDPLFCVINGLLKVVENYKSYSNILFKQI